MKLNLNLTIFGLLLILMTCQSVKLGTKKALKKSLSKKNTEKIEDAIETIKDSKINEDSDLEDWAKLGTNIASGFIKKPFGELISVSTDILFSFFDKKPKKEEAKNNSEPTDNVLRKSLDNINDKLENLQVNIMEGTQKIIDHLTSLIITLPAFKDLREELQSLLDYYDENNYKCFLSHDQNACPNVRKQEVINTLINPLSSRNIDLNKFFIKYIQTTGTPTDLMYHDKGIFEIMLDDYNIKAKEKLDCDLIPVRHSVYKTLLYMLLILKKYESMIVEAHMTRYRSSNTTFDKQKEFYAVSQVITQFNERTMSIIKSAKYALQGTSSEIRRCDPGADHKKGVTWDRFNLLFPIYIDQVMFCPQEKKDVGIGHYQSYSSALVELDLLNCKKIANAKKAWIYREKKINLNRPLFNHVEILFNNNTNKTYGDPKRNESNLVLMDRLSAVENSLCENGHVNIAVCSIPTAYNIITDNEVRWVSLAPVIATPNYTVTGIRWRFIKRMLYLEIQEGVYVDDRAVIKDTVRWKPTVEHGTDVTAVPIDGGIVKGFGLTNVILPNGYLVTGVQFDWNQEEDPSLARVFRINVRGTLMGEEDEDEDDSSSNTSIWKKAEWDYFTNKIELEEPDRSEYATNNEILSEDGDYIYFQQTDIIKDAAQTSVPYLDIQSVSIDTPVPLEGIGIYYKGQVGYGGFIGLRTLIPEGDEIIDEERLKVYTMATKIILEKIHNPKSILMTAMEFIDSLEIPEK